MPRKAIGCTAVIPSGVEGSRLGPEGWPSGLCSDPAVAGQVISIPALRAYAQYDPKGAPNRRCALDGGWVVVGGEWWVVVGSWLVVLGCWLLVLGRTSPPLDIGY